MLYYSCLYRNVNFVYFHRLQLFGSYLVRFCFLFVP